MNKILRPTNDLIFKLIFGDNKNTDLLANFLQAVLNLPEDEYSHLSIVDPHSRLERSEDKTVILDIKLHTTSGKIIDIEIQVADTPQIRDRILVYAAKMLTEQIGKGENYKLKKVISILITNFNLIHETSVYHHIYQLYDIATGSKFTDVLEINTLELPKVPKETDNTQLWNWLQFLRTDREEDYYMLAQANPQIRKAVGVLKELSQDERTRLLYEAREKAKWDEHSRLTGAYDKGIKQGIEQGIDLGETNKAIEIAKKALKNKMPIEDIMDYTGLTEKEIQELQE